MRSLIKAGLAVLVMSGIARTAVAGPLEDGLAAYSRRDYPTALQLLRPLADQGVPQAQSRLGSMYARGQGVEQDDAEAAKWYRKSADGGDLYGLDHLAGMYLIGGGGLPQDNSASVKLYREAATRGDADAQNMLGTLYENGWALPQDYVKAVWWYRKAADLGDASAKSSLGRMYKNGWGVSQDYVQAYKWYNLGGSADDRDSVATYMSSTQIAKAQQLAREWKPNGP